MSDEAGGMTTWRCTWQALYNGWFRVWVIADASLVAERETFADADEALADLLLDRRGDTDGIREYAPPKPVPTSEILATTPLVVLSGESLASRTNPVELFDGGLCPECKRWRGKRTDVSLKLASIRSGVDAATAVSR